MYLRNCWYVMAWSEEVTDQPLSRKLLNESLVLFRTESGEVAILADSCPHRHLPLSMGKVSGDNLQCGYHGMKFDKTGSCVSVPSQDLIPPKACIKAYPGVEKYGWIWVWMGDAEKASPDTIPDFHKLSDPDYAAVGKTNYVHANYRLVADNLLDLSHVGFVHTTTIGNTQMGEKGKLSVNRRDDGVQVVRLIPDVPPPPTYIRTGRLPEGKNIDRWNIIEFQAPCYVQIHVGGAEEGTGALEGNYEHGLNLWILNAMTPETEQTTHYFWAAVRQHALHDSVVDEMLFNEVSTAFEEDKRILEAQQVAITERGGDSWAVSLQADAGCFQARHALDKMIRQEQKSKTE